MRRMTVEEVREACGGTALYDAAAGEGKVEGGVVDSRLVEEGNLFFAMNGENVDGHNYVNKAFDLGASAAIVEREIPDAKGPCILVKSTAEALKQIAGAYRSRLEIPVIGITGSVGKTSTKEMVASVLSRKFCVLKTNGNFNNEIGVPLTLLRIRKEHQVAVVEMGIDHFGEMSRIAKVARPDYCIITNIGYCHLENLNDRDGVLKAKTEIFDRMPSRAEVFLNADDDKLATITGGRGITPVFFGIENRDLAEIYADQIEMKGEEGTAFTLHVRTEEIPAVVHVPGRHMVSNALAAAGIGKALGLSIEQIAEGISVMQTIAGRSNFLQKNGYTVIDDCYNANPMSMKASLEVLSSCKGRRVAVLGDMGELGKEEKELHYGVGTHAAGRTDALFVCGTLGTEIVRGAKDAGMQEEIFYFTTKEEMIPAVKEYVRENDTILVKASHFMGFSEIVENL